MSVSVGVDVGGTKTAIAAVRFPEAEVLDRIEFPTPPREASGSRFLAEVAARATALAARTGAAAVGVSVCELVGLDGGIESEHRVLWRGLRVAEAFPGRAAIVEADVRAGAAAEARFGAGTGFRDIFYVNLGTGISSSWVRDGEPHRGARGHALVLASGAVATVFDDGAKSVEDAAGAAGLLASYRAAGGEAASARDVFDRAAGGDVRAAEITWRAARALGSCIGFALNILDPEALLIGGGLALAGGAYGEPLEAAIRACVWSEATRALPILRARLGADSALIGAAALAARGSRGAQMR